MRILLVVLSLALNSPLLAQDYIVTNEGATITGKIYFDLKGRYGQDKVAIKNEDGLTKYRPEDIEEVVLDSEKYVAVKIRKQYQFAQVIEQGTLGFYLTVDPYNTKRLDFDTKTLIKKGGKSLDISSQGFKGKFKKMVAECETSVQAIDSKEFSKKKIQEVVRGYNVCINDLQSQKLIEDSALDNLSDQEALTLQSLISKVNKSDLDNKEEVNEMLSDVIKRLDNEESIPSYLRKAVLESFGDRQDWKEMFTQLID